MRLQELNEAKEDFSATVGLFKKTDEFKKLTKTFDYISSATQEKNGNLFFVSKPEVLRQPREYKISAFGQISTKNSGTSIWADSALYGKGVIRSEEDRFQVWKSRALHVLQIFKDWMTKRSKSTSDVTNRNLYSLVPLMLPNEIKGVETFECSHNYLTDLLGSPSKTKVFRCSFNELVSPLVGAPEEANVFDCSNNHLTSFEGFPSISVIISCHSNPIQKITGISKHIKMISSLLLIDPVQTGGYLELFKIKGLDQISSYVRLTGEQNLLYQTITTHLRSTDRDMLDCQEELMSLGLKEYAKL